MTRSLEGKTLFITGGSRGIGLAIAVRAAPDGAILARSTSAFDMTDIAVGTRRPEVCVVASLPTPLTESCSPSSDR